MGKNSKFGVVNENLINYNQTQLLLSAELNTSRCLFTGLYTKMRDILEMTLGRDFRGDRIKLFKH